MTIVLWSREEKEEEKGKRRRRGRLWRRIMFDVIGRGRGLRENKQSMID